MQELPTSMSKREGVREQILWAALRCPGLDAAGRPQPLGLRRPMALKKLALILLLIPIVASAGLTFIQSGQLRYVAAVGGDVASIATGGGRWIAWVERESGEARLVAVRHRGDRARVLVTADHLSGLAVADDAVFVTRSDQVEGEQLAAELLHVDLLSGRADHIALLPSLAEEIVAGDGYVCWREHRGPALQGVRFVAAAAPLDVLRMYDARSERTHTLAVIPGRTAAPADDVGLVAVAGEHLYWFERRESAAGRETLIRRAALPDGGAETLAREPGFRHVALAHDSILWTAPSLEAPRERSCSAVKRLFFRDSVPHTIADWLGSDGELQVSGDGIYFRERARLWRLGDARGEQRARSWRLPGAVNALIVDDEEYVFVRTGSGLAVASRPLSLCARLLRMLGA